MSENNNTNIISNSKKIRKVNQIQNENSKEETSIFLFNQLLSSIQSLTQEVKELKEQIKNNNS